MQDDYSLVERAKARDQQALTELYESNFDKIHRYVALRVGYGTDAEDITQQVFINALQSISSFKWKGMPFSSWLFRIAHNQVVDYIRREKKRVIVPLDESLPDVGDNPHQMAEREFDLQMVRKAMEYLTEAQREAISLRFTSELSISEVARVMGKSEGAVKALQHSGIAALRRVLAKGYGYGTE